MMRERYRSGLMQEVREGYGEDWVGIERMGMYVTVGSR